MPKLKEELQKTIRQIDNFENLKDHIEMTVTGEGLRIELMESEAGTFFESVSPAPSQNGREMLVALSQELGKLANKISLEGHTDGKPYDTPPARRKSALAQIQGSRLRTPPAKFGNASSSY